MGSVIFHNSKRFVEFNYDQEREFEAVIKSNARLLFGSSTIYIDLKARISSAALGMSIPDGILFDFKNIDSPDFYLVEVELAKHDFYRHIFAQVTKFIAFFRNPQSRNQLVEKVFPVIQADKQLEQEFRRFLKHREIFKFMKDAADDSQNILLIIDDMKPELPEILKTYTEWNKMVRPLILKEYRCGDERILSLSPEFESVELGDIPGIKTEEQEPDEVPHDEEYHLQGTDPGVRDIYHAIKSRMLAFSPNLRFNPRKSYISIAQKKNFAYLHIRKKKGIWITLMVPEKTIRAAIKNHRIHSETEKGQKFYGGDCASILVEDTTNLDEVIETMKMPISTGH